MRDMANTYRWIDTASLEVLAKKKRGRINTLENGHLTYLNKDELKRVRYHLKQIEAELRSRADQLDLF